MTDPPKIDDGGEASDMTLLDYFAGQATSDDIDCWLPKTMGELRAYAQDLGFGEDYRRVRIWAKYQYADAVIAEKRRREATERQAQPSPQAEALAVRKVQINERLAELLAAAEKREQYLRDLEAEVITLRKEPK